MTVRSQRLALLAAMTSLFLSACVPNAKPAPVPDETRTLRVIPLADTRFEPVSPSLPDGPAIAVLRGNPATGPSDMLLRMGEGASPMHTHSHGYRLVIIEGRMKHWPIGELEADAPILGPGSYWDQPANLPHADRCLSETCLMFITWDGPRDAQLWE